MGVSYDLHWKSIPMGAIQSYADWYEPYLGRGVYLLVLATTGGNYVGYYVGKSVEIGKRWRYHLDNWFCHPDGYSIPKNVDAFLEDPVSVINAGELTKVGGRAKRHNTVRKMLANTWFCWAEVDCHPEDQIEDVEYAIQEGLKKHVGITVDGEIGDARNRRRPTSVPKICNHFGRKFLVPVLPKCIL